MKNQAPEPKTKLSSDAPRNEGLGFRVRGFRI